MKNLTSLYNHFQERKWNQFLLKCNKTITFIFLFFVLLSANSFAQVAPVTVPSGGFSIDGGLKANTPTTGIGDWLFGVGGPGDSVLHSDGTPFNSKTSGRAKDPYNSNDDIFTNGSKFNDYIGNLRWFTNSSPDKNDINNALYHIARDTSNNQWAFIAGDRLSTSGTSYIDFEFLQGTVTKNSNGTFTGTPANDGKQSGGGRTDGDMLISMEYTNGGSKPNVYIYQWKLSGSIWAFQQVTNLTDLNLNAFAETNRTGPEDVSYGAFGSNTYAQYAFVEAAINVSYLLRQTSLNFCTGLSIKTLWVKTKASASSTAALKDFVTPIPVDFQFGTTNITAIGPFCLDNSTPQTLSATPSGGTFSGDGVSNNKFTPSIAGVGNHTISYSYSGCTDTTTVTVNALPTITGTLSVCAGSNTQLSGSATAAASNAWKSSDTSVATVSSTGSVTGISHGTATITYTNSNGCQATASVSVYDLPSITGNLNICVGATTQLAGSGTAATNAWSSSVTSIATVSNTGLVSGVGNGTTTITYYNSNGCPATATVTVNAKPAGPAASMLTVTCTDKTFSVQVTSPVSGITYSITQPGNTNTFDPITYSGTGNVIFSGLTFGDGYSIIATNSSGCTSSANTCGSNIVTRQLSVSANKTMVSGMSLPITIDEPLTKVSAVPNPYTNAIKFSLKSAVSGQATLEIYDMLGRKMKTVFNGYVQKGMIQNIEYNVPLADRSNLIYIFKVGNETKSGILIGGR